MIEFEIEPYKMVYTWTVAYAILEPFIAMANYLLYLNFNTKTMFQIYKNTSPFLLIACEYVYMTIVFVKTMYVYKHILKKPTYYPEQGAYKDYCDFIICFVVIMVIVDVLWSLVMNIITNKFPFLKFLNNYSRDLGIYALIRPVIFGITLILLSDAILYKASDIDAILAIFGSLLMIIIASF